MNSNYFHFTFSPTFVQYSEASTIKKISSSILPGENTDVTIGISIFDLPQKNVARIEKQSENDNKKNKPTILSNIPFHYE